MAARNDVLLTFGQVEAWRKERDILEQEIRDKSEKLRKIKLKLDAAEFFAGEPQSQNVEAKEHAPSPGNDEEIGERESIADVFCANMRETGDSLKVHQVRDRLVSLGYGDIIREKPNYVYGFVYRLTKSGRLLKRGMRYRAAPISSSEEETEAVGASVRH